jgi:hypothetical protein
VIGGTQRGAAWLSWLHGKRLVVGVGRYEAVVNHTEAAPGGCSAIKSELLCGARAWRSLPHPAPGSPPSLAFLPQARRPPPPSGTYTSNSLPRIS